MKLPGLQRLRTAPLDMLAATAQLRSGPDLLAEPVSVDTVLPAIRWCFRRKATKNSSPGAMRSFDLRQDPRWNHSMHDVPPW
jgi:hypothetical protein